MYYGMWRIGMDAVESVKPDFRKDGHIKAVRQNNDHVMRYVLEMNWWDRRGLTF